jgi:ParB family chromosome partitioning protein
MGHVKVLITLDDAKLISSIVEKIIVQGLSVRQVEELAKEVKEPKKVKETTKKVTEVPRNKRLESSIREKVDAKVKINGNDKGSIEFYFSSEEDLGRILEKLKLI